MFPGGQILPRQRPTGLVNEISKAVYESDRVTGTGANGVSRSAGGAQILDYSDEPRVVRITTTGSSPYSGTPQYFNGTTWADLATLVSAPLTNIYELSGRTDVPIGTRVQVTRNPSGVGWVFNYVGDLTTITNTLTPAATEITIDTFESAPKVAYSRTDFSVKKGAATADPKTVFLKYKSAMTFIEKLCPVYKWLSIVEGVLTGSDTDDGGVRVLADLTPQRKTFTPPNGMAITDVACSGLDTTCCASTWWCTGPDGSPPWTVLEVAYGGTTPVGGFGPYTTEAAATAACVEPEGGDPVEIACCPDNPVPRLLTITEVGGGSFPMEYSATIGLGSWGTAPLDSGGTYPGKITLSCGGETRIVLNGGGSCTITAFFGDGHECEGSSSSDPVITCSPFSMTFDLTFTIGDACGCIGQTRTFIITE